jgi:hypothetical protein
MLDGPDVLILGACVMLPATPIVTLAVAVLAGEVVNCSIRA